MATCQRRIGIFQGVYNSDDSHRLRVHPINCGSWACPVCGDRKARRIYARAMGGQARRNHGCYGHKLLTLTVPGAEYRGTHGIREAYEQGSKALTGLTKFLQYHLGQFHYLRVCELQGDGYPHWHVVLVGGAIAPKYVLKIIEDYWRGVCGMGFVKLNRIHGEDLRKAVGYVCKYLFKSAGQDWGDEMKGKRRYQASREMLGPVSGEPSKVWVHNKVKIGNVGRFVGVEFGSFCAVASDEMLDMECPGEVERMLESVMGPILRIRTEKREGPV